MTFKELLTLVSGENSLQVCMDSRLVNPGDIFVAVKGCNVDGHNFIKEALANGAEYIVCQNKVVCKKAEVVTVKNSAKASAILAQAAKGNPASKLTNLAVTGTNGKTTVAFLVQSIIKSSGYRCGLIGTVFYDTTRKLQHSTLTTPDPVAIAEMTSQMAKAGSEYMVVEASSHALSQDRLAAIKFKAAAFTNLTGDHLDYHKTTKKYLLAKTKLFKELPPDSIAVLNKQSPQSSEIARKTKAKLLWYSTDGPADLTAEILSIDTAGTEFVLEYASQKQLVKTPLVGAHNVSNCLAATGLCISVGFDLKMVTKGLANVKTIPGRLERVDWNGNFTVLIDYAHTDDALKNALSALKPLCKGKLITVFGCGGDRDKTKRPRMARVAEQLADYIIVTSDNPRTEQPPAIIGEIITGFENPVADTIHIESDREKAIKFAIQNASKNDIILIAGKGHEDYQIIGTKRKSFSDKKNAFKHLKKIG
ncbi:MAG: UDP-N-acetylmuramoyl-L-alanyl-D-glutamate--2,6-diaminopimelate ligase [Planctomycetota bacterium]|jgi:UDP-N-acetylmuramoyl-L-alanyl-D-glutamate--2,6-diaminopimelate ligase